MNLWDFFYSLDRLGVTEILLPFLLVFTIVFAVLQKTHIFGAEKKNMNMMIALIMGMTVIFDHILRWRPGRSVAEIINSALPQVSLIAVAIIMLLLMIGVFGARLEIAGTSLATWVGLFSLIAIIVIFGQAAGWGWHWPWWLRWLDDPDTVSVIIIVLVFGIVIAYITHEPKERTTFGGLKEAFHNLGKAFK
ncbi:hypothetical protein JW968_05090 [Candidatus Woesearchaeota archaeon]|nr:hypothetical protein [Candidatus Woesearchaeota archaeon]